MNKVVFVVMTFCFAMFSAFPQDKELEDIANSIMNSELVEGVKDMMLFNMLEIEKKGFIKDIDSITDNYRQSIKEFYTHHYTDEEIQQIAVFYQSGTGKKFLSCRKRIEKALTGRNNENPDFKIKGTANESSEMNEFITVTGLYEFIATVKEYEIQWIEPQKVSEYNIRFDSLQKQYIRHVKENYSDALSKDEISEILNFYKTPVGKKMGANSVAYYSTTISAFNKWNDDFTSLYYNLNHGKYQKP